MESLQESINNMKEMFQKRMAGFEAELPKMQGTHSLSSLASEYAIFKTFVMDSIKNLQQQIEILARTVDTMEMRGRRKMLLLHGVAEDAKEETAKVVVKVAKEQLKMSNVTTEDIRRCHRMGRPSAEHKPRPIVVKFNSITVRDALWFAKTKFKGSGITASEFLTKQRHETFMAAREKFGVAHSWTREGIIHVCTPDGVRHRLQTMSELAKIEEHTEKSATAAKPVTKAKRAVHKK